MSYDTHANADGTANGYNQFRHHNGDAFGWARRPGFNPMKAVAVIAGIAIFPPLGLAALAYFIWNERRSKRDGSGYRNYRGEGRGGCGRGRGMGRSGNVAFDENRAKVMQDLEDERRAFAEHRAEERRKRDQEAFEVFKDKQANKQTDKGDEQS